jgi:hypothetical protein
MARAGSNVAAPPRAREDRPAHRLAGGIDRGAQMSNARGHKSCHLVPRGANWWPLKLSRGGGHWDGNQ